MALRVLAVKVDWSTYTPHPHPKKTKSWIGVMLLVAEKIGHQ
jgi:hypothetical protein